MVPYIQIPPLDLGVVQIHAFGVLTAIGIALGARLAERRAGSLGLDVEGLRGLWSWALVGAWLGAHLFHTVLYHPEELRARPWALLELWRGFSSFGGVVGALAAAAIYFRKRGLSFIAYSDAVVFGLGPGWMFGRLGCFTAHDHPGVLTDFPLAVAFPGGARHDLGLYEALLLAALSIVVALLARARARPGVALGVFALVYMPSRFLFDFLRATDGYADARYAGFTPAQILAVPLAIAGAALLWRSLRRDVSLTSPEPTTTI